MRDIPIRGKGRYKFDRCIAHHHIFSLERNGRNQEHNSLVRIEHAKRKEHAVASAGSTDRSPRVEVGTHRHDSHARIYDCVVLESLDVVLAQLPRFLTKAGADAADKVVDQEALEAQRAFDHHAKHPEREHIEEQVRQSVVEKHIRDELPRPKVVRQDEMEAEHLRQVCDASLLQYVLREQDNAVDDQQIFRDGRGLLKWIH